VDLVDPDSLFQTTHDDLPDQIQGESWHGQLLDVVDVSPIKRKQVNLVRVLNDISSIDILSVDILSVDILSVDILSIDILCVDILSTDI
jgi:hypothetical protein